MNCFFTMKKKLAGTQIQGGLFPITVFKKKKTKKAWLGLRSTINCNNPGPTACIAILYLNLLGVCHEASHLCCVNKRHEAFLDLFPSLSHHVFPSLAHTVVHKPILLHTTLPHHHPSHLCQTKRSVLFSSSPLRGCN